RTRLRDEMVKRRHRGMERRIAAERMVTLFRLAESEALHRRAGRSRRYVELARRIGMRYNVRVPALFKRSFCKKCLAFLLPSVTARVRIGRGRGWVSGDTVPFDWPQDGRIVKGKRTPQKT